MNEKKNISDFTLRFPLQTYLQDPFQFAVAELLGAYLCSSIGGRLTAGMITEVEVYIGSHDKACHAYPNKLTKRTATMFKQGGCAYVFFVYGMYNQFNVVTSPTGEPNAILVRSLEPMRGIETMCERRGTKNLLNLTTGPGKLCQALGITAKEHDGVDLRGDLLWISPGEGSLPYLATPRIGINYAQEYKDKLWRFCLKDSKYVSR